MEGVATVGNRIGHERAIVAAIVAAAPAIAKILAELSASPPAIDAAPAWLEEKTIADRFGLEGRALVSARKRGDLVGRRVGRRVLLEVAAVERWIAGARASQAEAPKVTPIDVGLARGTLRRIGGAR